MTRVFIHICAFLAIAFLSASSAVTEFHVDSDRDTRFLPYQFNITQNTTYSDCRKSLATPVHVLRPEIAGGDSAIIACGYNAPISDDATGSIFIKTYRGHITGENPTFMTIEDFGLFYDSDIGQEVIASGCYMHDSAFVERIITNPHRRDTLFLATGIDRTGNGSWEPDINFIAAIDYDYDGVQEVFFQVNPIRDKEPRILFCLDLQNMRVEWSLPVAPNLQRGNLVSCNDSLHPAIIFGTYPPSQGVTDQYFDDSYAYLTKVNSEGKIIFQKLSGVTFDWTSIIPADNDSTFFVAHSLPFLEPSQADTSLLPEYEISLIDRDGNIIRSTHLLCSVNRMWLSNYDSDEKGELYVKLHDGRIRIYDENLNLLAESNNSLRGDYLGSIEISGEKEPVMIFGDSGLTIYSHQFKKLASAGLEYSFSYFEELGYDAKGNTAELIAGGGSRYFIAGIIHLTTPELLNIYIAEYRYYLLAVAFAMLIILIAMNIYRARMKRHLVLITRQKDEIERTHEQLKKAYVELEHASETIAVQREREAAASQYRIASAQFRHEINNALGAVKLFVSNAIQRISSGKNQNMFEERYNRLSRELTILVERLPELDPEMEKRFTAALSDMKSQDNKLLNGLEEIVLKGINRGLSLSDKLRRLERIDYDDAMEEVDLNVVVDSVLSEHQPIIEQYGIHVTRERDGAAVIKGSGQLFEIMFRNLLDNSIDAVIATGSDHKEINIAISRPGGSRLEIVWRDNGVGISRDNYEKIFQPFYTEKPKTGSGLGLSMVRNIVSKYKGNIEIESVVGQYTEFRVAFNLS